MNTKRPKRRTDKDYPYTIQITESKKYTVSFTDGLGVLQTVEISKELFEQFDRFELEEVSQHNEKERHYEKNELSEEMLLKRAFAPPKSVESTVIDELERKQLLMELECLPETPRTRLKMYFFENLTYEEIARKYDCTYQAIQCSLEGAIKILKKKIK